MKDVDFEVSIDHGDTDVTISISESDYRRLKRVQEKYDAAMESDEVEEVDDLDFYFSPGGDGSDIYWRVYKKALPLILEQAEEFGHLPDDYDPSMAIDDIFDIYIRPPESFDE